MSYLDRIEIAAKCAPEEGILVNIEKAGITTVELFTNLKYLNDFEGVKRVCKKFPFHYAVHAPNEGFEMNLLAELVDTLEAKTVVFHNIYWEDEWEDIMKVFKGIKTQLCIENTFSALEPLKFMRRFKMGLCLDLEHLQMECSGIFEEAFVPLIKMASHIHLTGYSHGSDLWHTHIHHSPEHSTYLLNLLRNSDYSGFVVSEAKTSLQTLTEFNHLNKFFQKWQNKKFNHSYKV